MCPSWLGWIPGLRIFITFLVRRFFLFQNITNDSVNHAESDDIKILDQFPGISILEILTKIWKCVGCGHVRGHFWKIKGPNCDIHHFPQFEQSQTICSFDLSITYAFLTPVKSSFWAVFPLKAYLLHPPPPRDRY